MHLSAMTNFWVLCGSLKVLWATPQDYLTKIQLQRQKLNFRHVRFLCDFCAISGERKAAARLLQGTQGVRTTDIRVLHPRICLTKATRLPRDDLAFYCKAAARILRNVQLPLKIAQWPHGCIASTVRRLALSCSMAILLQPCM